MNNENRHTARQLLELLGIAVEEAPTPYADNIWSGTVLRIDPRHRASELFHEIGHWLIAPADRRSLRNYGLGEVGGIGPRREAVVSVEQGQLEEEYASVLGIALEFHLDADWAWTYRFHSWDWLGGPWSAIGRLLELEQRGLVRRGYPLVLDLIDQGDPS
jgi:hypothetical protein